MTEAPDGSKWSTTGAGEGTSTIAPRSSNPSTAIDVTGVASGTLSSTEGPESPAVGKSGATAQPVANVNGSEASRIGTILNDPSMSCSFIMLVWPGCPALHARE
ncbi:MAG: hypothetical protein HRU13_09240 [Phycisphaerales bacterium]|nr:hypothetical protein [Phycisphaerales bacterium]